MNGGGGNNGYHDQYMDRGSEKDIGVTISAVPESSAIEAGIPYHPHGDALIPDHEVAHYAGDLNHPSAGTTSTGNGGDSNMNKDMLVIQPNTIDIESEVAKTYGVGGGDYSGEEQRICGIFKSKFQLYVAIGALVLMAVAAALMGAFIPPALASKRDASEGGDGGGTTIDPALCDGSQGCITDASTLGRCFDLLSAPSTTVGSDITTMTLCTGTHTLTEPLQLQLQTSTSSSGGETSSDSGTVSQIKVACEEPATYQQGSPCVLEAGADTPMFVNVINELYTATTTTDELNNFNQTSNVQNYLSVNFVDMTFSRPIFNDETFESSGANGAFLAPNATLDFLSCSFLDAPLGFYFDALNVTFDLAYVARSGSPDVVFETTIPAAPAMKFVLYDTHLSSIVADAVRPPADDGSATNTTDTTPISGDATDIPDLPPAVADGSTTDVIVIPNRPKSHVTMTQSLLENNTCSVLIELEVDKYRYGGNMFYGTDIMNNDATTTLITSKANSFSLAAEAIFNLTIVEDIPSLGDTAPVAGAGTLVSEVTTPVTTNFDLCRFENNTSFHIIELNHPGSNIELNNLEFMSNEGNMITVLNATKTIVESVTFNGNGPKRVLDTNTNVFMGLPGDMLDVTSRDLSMTDIIVESNDYSTDTIGSDSILNLRASPTALAAGQDDIQGTKTDCEACKFVNNRAKGEIVSMASYQNADFSGSVFRNNTVNDSIVKHIFGEIHTCNNCIFEDNNQLQSIGMENEAIVFLMGAGRLDKCIFRGNNFNRGVTMIGATESLGIVTDSCFIDNIFGGDSIIKYGYVPRPNIITAVTSSNYAENNQMAANTGVVTTPPCNGVLYGSLGTDGTCAPLTAQTCAAPIPQGV